ncbi:hypothetical protein T492DRAFT_878858 [Pavlovales sp. CCMP2436]|nr:hypothetical protein T492DRAFT_878858 [Pavlovales sp. CCMP2436]
MGVHLNTRVAAAVGQIMRYAPATTVLASATLGSWGGLPKWWYGDGKAAL